MNKAVIMDRDGTILRDSHYLSDPAGIEIYRGVIPALGKLRRRGWKLIIGSNQSGIGRGYFDLKTLGRIHRRLLELVNRKEKLIADIFFCPHRPDDGCDCRKPAQGMLRQAARKHKLDLKKCVVVGDKECDIVWGKNGGAKTVLVLTGSGRKARRRLKVRPDHVAPTFARAAEWILRQKR